MRGEREVKEIDELRIKMAALRATYYKVRGYFDDYIRLLDTIKTRAEAIAAANRRV